MIVGWFLQFESQVLKLLTFQLFYQNWKWSLANWKSSVEIVDFSIFLTKFKVKFCKLKVKCGRFEVKSNWKWSIACEFQVFWQFGKLWIFFWIESLIVVRIWWFLAILIYFQLFFVLHFVFQVYNVNLCFFGNLNILSQSMKNADYGFVLYLRISLFMEIWICVGCSNLS